MTEYKVALDVYSGPLDLLLFLIRREEIDIHNIPIARITQQYVEHLDLLALVDPEVVGDFLVLAATLMEIKSRTLLPSPPADEGDDELVDPRSELIRQLLEYKRFKDAAHQLEDDAAERAMKFSRMPGVLPTVEEELELENLQVWDLFDAFRRLLEQTGQTDPVHQVGITAMGLWILDNPDLEELSEVCKSRNRWEFLISINPLRLYNTTGSPVNPIAIF